MAFDHDKFREYVHGLEAGERVIETEHCCFHGRMGTVYISEYGGGKCVLWDEAEGETGQMGTSITGGTRRLHETELEFEIDE